MPIGLGVATVSLARRASAAYFWTGDRRDPCVLFIRVSEQFKYLAAIAQLGITLALKNRANGKAIKPSLGGPSAHSSGVSARQADTQESPARCPGVPSSLANTVLTCFLSSITVVVHWRPLTQTLDSGESMVTP
jgi:hypothetical protein